MWQSVLIGLIVSSALLYVIWTLMPSRWRLRLRVRLHLGPEPLAGSKASGGASVELPCDHCAHNSTPHIRSHN